MRTAVARACVLAFALCFGAATRAQATDYVALRLDPAFGTARAAFYEAGVGTDFDFFAEYLGGRLGAVLSLHDFPGESAAPTRLLLSPEIAAHFGDDGDVVRMFVAVQPQFAIAAFDGDAAFIHGLRAGPQLEWRQVPQGLRIGLAVFVGGLRDPSDRLLWAALAVRLNVAYAFGLERKLKPVSGPLCPDGLPPLEGFGCTPVAPSPR